MTDKFKPIEIGDEYHGRPDLPLIPDPVGPALVSAAFEVGELAVEGIKHAGKHFARHALHKFITFVGSEGLLHVGEKLHEAHPTHETAVHEQPQNLYPDFTPLSASDLQSVGSYQPAEAAFQGSSGAPMSATPGLEDSLLGNPPPLDLGPSTVPGMYSPGDNLGNDVPWSTPPE